MKSKTMAFACLLLHVLIVAAHAQSKKPVLASKNELRPVKTWAVVVGISKYKNIQGLKYADKDAQAFYNYLIYSNNGPRINPTQVRLLLNDNARSTEIYGALDWLKESVKANDRVVFYFSGHGDVEKLSAQQNGFLLAYDSPQAAYLTSGTVSVAYLQRYLETYIDANKAQNVILIADACRSGKLSGGARGTQLTMRALGQEHNKKIIKILSAQENELSLEGTLWGGGRGAFSYYLIKGMEGLADRNGDNKITAAELAAFLPNTLADATGNIQHPAIEGDPQKVLFKFTKIRKQTLAGSPALHRLNADLGTGIAEEIDTATQRKYLQYLYFVKQGRLVLGYSMQDTGHCAMNFYRQLIDDPNALAIRASLKSSFLAALQRKTQENLDNYVSNRDMVNGTDLSMREMAEVIKLISPNDILYSYIMARAYFMQGMDAKINLKKPYAALLKKALQYEPDAAIILNELAMTYPPATTDSTHYYLKKAIKAAPGWGAAYINSGVAYEIHKQYQLAIDSYNKANSKRPSAQTYYDIGCVYLDMKNYKMAVKYYKIAVARDTTTAIYYTNLGASLMYTGDFKNGTINLERALAMQPENIDAYYNLACLYSLKKDTTTSLEYLRKGIDKGLTDIESVLQDADLVNLRKTEGFALLRKKYFPAKPQ